MVLTQVHMPVLKGKGETSRWLKIKHQSGNKFKWNSQVWGMDKPFGIWWLTWVELHFSGWGCRGIRALFPPSMVLVFLVPSGPTRERAGKKKRHHLLRQTICFYIYFCSLYPLLSPSIMLSASTFMSISPFFGNMLCTRLFYLKVSLA